MFPSLPQPVGTFRSELKSVQFCTDTSFCCSYDGCTSGEGDNVRDRKAGLGRVLFTSSSFHESSLAAIRSSARQDLDTCRAPLAKLDSAIGTTSVKSYPGEEGAVLQGRNRRTEFAGWPSPFKLTADSFSTSRGLHFHLSADRPSWGSQAPLSSSTSSRSKFAICALWHSFYLSDPPDWCLCL